MIREPTSPLRAAGLRPGGGRGSICGVIERVRPDLSSSCCGGMLKSQAMTVAVTPFQSEGRFWRATPSWGERQRMDQEDRDMGHASDLRCCSPLLCGATFKTVW
jgi:hypothetical protein